MSGALRRLLSILFPYERQSAAEYVSATTTSSEYLQHIDDLTAASANLSNALDSHLYAHAKEHVALEERRADSIISRAQALLVAQTFLGGLLALGGTTIGHTQILTGVWIYLLAPLLLYLLSQILLLTWNALRAVGGLEYKRIGSSDLARWLPKGESIFLRRVSLLHLDHYRSAALSNTWRFSQLANAQQSLRNIVATLSFLVVLLFAAELSTGTVASRQPMQPSMTAPRIGSLNSEFESPQSRTPIDHGRIVCPPTANQN